MFQGKTDKIRIQGLLVLILVAGVGCTGSNFAGGGSKSNGNTKEQDNKDGENEGGSGSAEAGTGDTDAGNSNAEDATDAGAADAEGIDGADAGDADGLSDGDEELKKTRSDLKIIQTLADTQLKVRVELLSNAKVIQSEEFDSDDGDGKINKETVLRNMCRKGLDTCVKVTFIGKATQVTGAAACVFTTPLSATKIKIDVDGNGAGGLGNCGPDEDETFEFSCDESKSLKVQGCTG